MMVMPMPGIPPDELDAVSDALGLPPLPRTPEQRPRCPRRGVAMRDIGIVALSASVGFSAGFWFVLGGQYLGWFRECVVTIYRVSGEVM